MKALFLAATAAVLASSAAGATQTNVKFNLINVGGAAPGTFAYNGFLAATNYWSSVLTTSQPVTINLQIGFGKLGPNILGQTSSSYDGEFIAQYENLLKSTQSTALDSQLKLPALYNGQYGKTAVRAITPGYTDPANKTGIDLTTKVYDADGSLNNSAVALTTANAKAIGLTAADGIYGANNPNQIDGSVVFSSQFKFDFNPRDGITAGTSDFYAVAIHEIGHALGFVSGVDSYDVLGGNGPCATNNFCGTGVNGQDYDANDDFFDNPLDLFRYSSAGHLDWTPATASYFSIDGGVTAYQNGLFSTGSYNGDSWQASHWKAPQVIDPATGKLVFSCKQPKLGILNPYICDGANGVVTGLDLALYDAIGYNTSIDVSNYGKTTAQIAHDLTFVPEPATWALMLTGFGFVGAVARRRQAGYATA